MAFINDEDDGLIKSISDYEALDNQKKEQPKDESKIQTEKEEKKNINISINKMQNNKKNIKFQCIKPKFSHKTPQKRIKKSIIRESTIDKIEYDNLDKLRSHLFQIHQIMKSCNISIIESKLVNLNQTNKKLEKGINKLYEKSTKQSSLSEANKICQYISYLYEEKKELLNIIENISKTNNLYNEVIFQKVDIEQNRHKKQKGNYPFFANEIKSSSHFSTQENDQKKDEKYLGKKRILQEKKIDEVEIKENNYIKTEKSNDNKNGIIPNKKGRLSKNSKNNGIKGIKDDTHPDNGLNKMMRHSLKNIYCIFKEILQIIDQNISIFFPGIKEKDLKNTTTKQNYLEKSIYEILCVHISNESQRKEFEKNKKIIDDLLKEDIHGKEEIKTIFLTNTYYPTGART